MECIWIEAVVLLFLDDVNLDKRAFVRKVSVAVS